MSLSLRNNQLLALLKVSGPKSSNAVLVGLNAANTGTVLLQTGQSVTVDGADSTIKKITVLSPAKGFAGDGRWQGSTRSVARVELADKRTVIYSITTAGALTPVLFSDQDASAVTNGATWSKFGLPAIGGSGSNYAALGTLARGTDGVSKSTDTALVFSTTGATFTPFAQEGSSPADPSLSDLTYAGFSDPLVNGDGNVAFIATLKGKKTGKKNNRALLFGSPGTLQNVARVGDPATDATGAEDNVTWSSFIATALPGGTNGAPIFLAKVGGKSANKHNNVGLWAVDSTGLVRRLLRTGDDLGGLTISKITLLNTVRTATSAARSFNGAGSIAVLLNFTNKTEALVKIGIP